MSYSKLQELVEARLKAVEQARASEDPETQRRALEAASDYQHQINATLAEIEREREDEKAKRKFELQTHTDAEVALREERKRLNQDIYQMIRGERAPRIELIHPECRTENPLTTSTADTTDYAYYNIATELWNQVIFHENAQSGVLKAGPKIIRTPGDNPLYVPTLVTDAAAAAGTEAQAQADSAYPVFGRVTLGSYRQDGYMIVSDEMMRTPEYPFADVLSEIAARALAEREAQVLARGSGSGEPTGVFVAASTGYTTVSQTTFTMDELRNLYFAPTAGERARGTWLLSTPAMLTLALMQDGNGNYIWRGATEASLPDTLLGRPCYEEAYADANNAIGAGEKHVVFGGIDGFWVRYAGRLVIEFSREARFTEWVNVIRFGIWLDSKIVRPGSIYALVQHG